MKFFGNLGPLVRVKHIGQLAGIILPETSHQGPLIFEI